MPLRAAQQRHCVAAATGRGGVDRHAESTLLQLQLSSCGPVEPAQRNSEAVSKSTSQTVAGEHTKTSNLWRMIRRYSQAFGMRLTSGRAKTTSVIDAINRRAGHGGQLASTYPYNSKQSIRQPCALSDYNNGATLIRAGMCVHVFPSNLQFGEADGDAPV
jgi:hypothetical protein